MSTSVRRLTTNLSGLYYKLHGVHRPTTMKKATIKRRKRVIPAGEDEEMDGVSQTGDRPVHDSTPEKGTMNSDGSINLGFRRNARQPMAIQPQAPPGHPGNAHKQPSPLSGSSDLAAYHQQSALRPHNMPQSLKDDNRLPPITSLAASGPGVDRQSSISPASFLSPARKRSFSSTDNEPRNYDDGSDNSKRLSSIKSILNPTSQNGGRSDDRHEYSLPPLRSPGTTVASAPSPGLHSTRDPTPALSDVYSESEQTKADRRAALQREAERMREMLAAKERELMALGND